MTYLSSSYNMYILYHQLISFLPCLGSVFLLHLHLYTIYVFYINSNIHEQTSFYLLLSILYHTGTIHQLRTIHYGYICIILYKSVSRISFFFENIFNGISFFQVVLSYSTLMTLKRSISNELYLFLSHSKSHHSTMVLQSILNTSCLTFQSIFFHVSLHIR